MFFLDDLSFIMKHVQYTLFKSNFWISWSYQLVYFDVSCVCDNHYVLLTQLSKVLQSREPDVFEKMIQIYNHQHMAKVVKGEENKGNIVSDSSSLTDDGQNTSSSHHP